ncbi:MAG TPA: FAD-dependent oxidoreductase [Gemmatimonadaceae bacterium]|nr:FAD-dependent oxidoreductase [Gemmatimonadaceae bacterium]
MALEAVVLTAEVAVVGAGPAGIAATVTLAEAGRPVILIDEGVRPGGQIWRHASNQRLPRRAARWVERLDRCGATILNRASVIDFSVGGEARQDLLVERDGAAVVVRASKTILATGARELFLPFPGWTLPGVVGIGGVQALMKSGFRVAGKRVVVAGSGPLMLPVAAMLVSNGASLAMVAEQADASAVVRFVSSLWRSPALAIAATRYRAGFSGSPYRAGTWVTRADGDQRIEEVTLTNGRRSWCVPCNLLCTGFGLVPNTELATLCGCSIAGGAIEVDAWERTTVSGVLAAGECAGVGGVDVAVLEGQLASCTVTGNDGLDPVLVSRRDRLRAQARTMDAAFTLRGDVLALADPDTIICRCEDARMRDLLPEWSARQVKLHARMGMGPCQGRVCATALRFLRGWDTATVRAPVQPAAVGTLTKEAP